MAYLAEKQTVQASERQLITIEFVPPQDPNETEYSIPQPLFIFTEQVIQKNNPFNPFKICAMELVESTTPSGKLLNQPYWKYKLTNGSEQIWKDESTDSYLNQAEWYFRLRSNDDASAISQSLWVREDEICFFDMSHNISTANIF